MKIDISQDTKDHTYTIAIKIDQFKTLKDYEVIHNLINAISLDFDLDPEISIEDLKNIVIDRAVYSDKPVYNLTPYQVSQRGSSLSLSLSLERTNE